MRLGDMFPDLARTTGMDVLQEQQLAAEVARWDGRVVMVTFQEAAARDDGKRDPVGFLPPGFREYAIVDRDHRHRVQVGETWVCEIVQRGGGITKFLIPRFRLTLQSLLDLKPEMIKVVAEAIARMNPSLARQFSEKLPDARRPVASDGELTALRSRADELSKRVAELDASNAALQAQVEEHRARAAAARASSPASAETAPVGNVSTDSPLPVPGERPALSARRVQGDVIESASFTHEAYEAHFTPDLTRVLLRPARGARLAAAAASTSLGLPAWTRAPRRASIGLRGTTASPGSCSTWTRSRPPRMLPESRPARRARRAREGVGDGPASASGPRFVRRPRAPRSPPRPPRWGTGPGSREAMRTRSLSRGLCGVRPRTSRGRPSSPRRPQGDPGGRPLPNPVRPDRTVPGTLATVAEAEGSPIVVVSEPTA